jgi:hypothetical protein
MEDVKGIFASRTVWALALTVVAMLAQQFGYEISSEEQAKIIDLVANGVGYAGAIAAIYFRVKATKKIGK